MDRPAPLTFRSWLSLFTSFVILTVAFAFGLFCWPAVYRPLVKAFGWNFASANAGGAMCFADDRNSFALRGRSGGSL